MLMRTAYFWKRLVGLLCLTPHSTIVQLSRGGQIMAGENWNTREKNPTCRMTLSIFIT